MSLEALKEFSNRYGSNPAYVLAGGGNTSWKDAGTLYVKASGQALATIGTDGFVALDRAALDALFTRTYSADTDEREAEVLADMMAARLPGEESKRPSVEALLHNVIPDAFVLHLHPLMAGGLVCGTEGKAAFECLFSADGIWIEPTMPGYYLATVVRKAIAEFNAIHGVHPKYIFLENHGVFTGADSVEDLDAAWDELTRRLESVCAVKPETAAAEYDHELAGTAAAALRGIAGGYAVYIDSTEARKAAADAESFAKVYITFTPDHMVYCGSKSLFVECDPDAESILTALDAYKGTELPKIVGIKGVGVFALGDTVKTARTTASLYDNAAQLAVYASNFGGGKSLPEELIRAISNWEVERYRKGVASGPKSGGRAAGKVIIITGAAQGFGRGIAEELAAEGAIIVAADLNLAGAQDLADQLCAKYGDGMGKAVSVNVADEDQVKAMAYDTACAYGGIDALISNAGIVRAGGLEDMTLPNFTLSTNINYTAFFLCTKYASRIMKLQHRFNPEATFDIVQVNSKSGLVGSNKNFAYAGSKFGGIGLVQSFALELVTSNVKVNAVCPGNFLDGPLWSDPVRGLFVQYLNAGKVPGAKTVADVKAFYEAKVPMNRGCHVHDVVLAILYILEQQYETGQALPVTGGQSMLH